MGVIARQSSKRTIVSFAGVFIGALSTLFIYPLDTEIYGLALFLFSAANLLMIAMGMGSHGLVIKYFPIFKKEGIPGFVSLMLAISSATILLTTFLLWLLKQPLAKSLEWLHFDVGMIAQYSDIIYWLAVCMVFIYLLNYHASNYRRIVIPTIIIELTYKVILPVLVLLSVGGWLTQSRFTIVYAGYFAMVLLGIIAYLIHIKGLKLEAFKWAAVRLSLKREMVSYMFYSGLNQAGATIVARIDTIMVATLISLNETGIYGILLFMANVIDIPVRSINQIAGPVLSESLAHNDRQNVLSVYRKSSVNALVAGLYLFILIWALLPDIIAVMPEGEPIYAYQQVFLFLGLGKLVDMAFSTNTHILIYSRYYRYNLLFVLMLGITNLLLNYYLIDAFGAVGAAMATAISLALYNLVKLIFIQYTLRYWPFSLNTLRLVALGIISFFTSILLPSFFMSWIDLLVKGLLITAFYYGLIRLFRIRTELVTEAERLVVQAWKKVRFSK